MLMYSRWQTAAILGVTAFFCLAAVPNVLPARALAALPGWATRTVPLGIDLQGGAYFQFEVDAQDLRKQMIDSMRDDVRRVLRDQHIGYVGLTARGDSVEFGLRAASDMPRALPLLQAMVGPVMDTRPASELRAVVVGRGEASLTANRTGYAFPASANVVVEGQTIRLTVTQAAIDERMEQRRRQQLEILKRRTSAIRSDIRPVGSDRIVLDMPGESDPWRLIYLIH